MTSDTRSAATSLRIHGVNPPVHQIMEYLQSNDPQRTPMLMLVLKVAKVEENHRDFFEGAVVLLVKPKLSDVSLAILSSLIHGHPGIFEMVVTGTYDIHQQSITVRVNEVTSTSLHPIPGSVAPGADYVPAAFPTGPAD